MAGLTHGHADTRTEATVRGTEGPGAKIGWGSLTRGHADTRTEAAVRETGGQNRAEANLPRRPAELPKSKLPIEFLKKNHRRTSKISQPRHFFRTKTCQNAKEVLY